MNETQIMTTPMHQSFSLDKDKNRNLYLKRNFEAWLNHCYTWQQVGMMYYLQ